MTARPAASRSEREAALRLLFADTSEPGELAGDVDRVLVLAEAGEIDLSGLLIADGFVSGATLVTPGPGGVADLFPPRLAPAAPSDAAATLLGAAATFAAAVGCGRLQGFADPVRTDEAAALLAAGFERTAELRTLRRCCSKPAESGGEAGGSRLSLTRETGRRFRETIRESYGDSRDAPDARGADADADFAAHAAAPGFRPDLCRLATVGDADAGCVLIAVSGEGNAAEWDVCYLGVAPAFRGRGVGRGLLAGRLAAARDAGAAAVTCAVDAANEPARRLYAAAGFTETSARALFTKRLEPGG